MLAFIIVSQLFRCGATMALNYCDVQSFESQKGFVHKENYFKGIKETNIYTGVQDRGAIPSRCVLTSTTAGFPEAKA